MPSRVGDSDNGQCVVATKKMSTFSVKSGTVYRPKKSAACTSSGGSELGAKFGSSSRACARHVHSPAVEPGCTNCTYASASGRPSFHAASLHSVKHSPALLALLLVRTILWASRSALFSTSRSRLL